MAAPVEEGMVAATVEEEGAVASSEEERRGRRREMDGAVALEKERRGSKGQTEGVEVDADLSCEVHEHDICRGGCCAGARARHCRGCSNASRP